MNNKIKDENGNEIERIENVYDSDDFSNLYTTVGIPITDEKIEEEAKEIFNQNKNKSKNSKKDEVMNEIKNNVRIRRFVESLEEKHSAAANIYMQH